jgi:tetratricopeptide (TPR) repeat protein
VARGPAFPWAHFNLGLALAKAGRLLDACTAYDRAIELDPRFAEALADRALVELELDRLERARSDLRRAIELGRKDIAILAAFGETLARLGRSAEAERYFTDLLASDPDDLVVRVARGFARIKNDAEAARGDFAAALILEPRHAHAHYGMALVVRGHDLKGALHHLDLALASDPHLTDALQVRALLRARLGDRGTLDDVDRLIESATCHRLYNAACAVAIYMKQTGDRRQAAHAMALLSRALRSGFPAREAAVDPDLEALRKLPEFGALVGPGSFNPEPAATAF